MQEHAISVKDISFQHSLIFLLKTVDQFINPASPGASASLCSYVMPIVKSSYRSQYDLVIFFFPSWKSILLHQTGSHHIDHGGCFVSMFTTSFRRFPIIWRASRLTSWASHLFSFFYFIPLSCYSSGLFIYVTHIATSLCGKLPLFSELWLFEFIWPCLKLMSPSGWLRKILLITQLIQSWCPRYGPWTHLKETRTHSIAQFSRTAEDKQQWFNVSVNTVMLPSGQ